MSRKCLIYASTTLGSRIISSVFYFYYVKIVLDKYHMSQAWFQISQLLFAIWNAANDPWFGYLQDTSTGGWMAVRRKCILYGAIPWVISFLIPWFPWADYSNEANGFICFLQGLIAQCMFDTFFTFCLLAHCALMTEYAESDRERLALVKYAGMAGIFGSSSVFFANYFSVGLADYATFQKVCIVQAVLASGLFYITGCYAVTKYDVLPNREPPQGSYWGLTKDILKNKNFLYFVIMNFMQELHISYIQSFAKIFSEQMIPEAALSNSTRSLLLGALMILPQVAVVVATPIVAYFGLYQCVMSSFYVKICLGLLMFISGVGNSYWFLVFLIADFVLSDGPFTFFSVLISDIADEDKSIHLRKKPIASMFFGTNALIVKPALSVSPMIISGVLNSYSYDTVKSGKASFLEEQNLQRVIFQIACFFPVVIGVLQILVWQKYKLTGENESTKDRAIQKT